MKTHRILPFPVFLILVSSCATKYTRVSNSIFSEHTGYSEVPVDTNAWQVSFVGNSATDIEVVDRYALYRAAELTIDNGYDYFIVDDRQPDSLTALITSPIEKRVDFSSAHAGRVNFEVTHFATKTIRMFYGVKPSDNPSAYNAKSLLAVMWPTINQ